MLTPWILAFLLTSFGLVRAGPDHELSPSGGFPVFHPDPIKGPGNHVCVSSHTEEQKYDVKCSFWKWGRCTRYRDVTIYNYFCCDGYQNWIDDYTECNNPICARKINAFAACTQTYNNDFIKYRSQQTQSVSGGYCSSPEQCAGCHDGFYANGGMCDICPKIDHCWHRKCSSPATNICKYCDGAILEQEYWRAYTSATDGKKSCKQACSWRSDSTRCYPGKCTQETSDTCVCMTGFTGHHCDEIIDAPSITDQLATLQDNNFQTVQNPTDISGPYSYPMPTIWTNNKLIKRVTAYFTGVFKVDVDVADLPPVPSPGGTAHYVTDFKYGIIGGKIKFNLYRGGTVWQWPEYSRTCQGSYRDPTNVQYTCTKSIEFSAWGEFRHDDKLYFDLSVKNGGYVTVLNRENPSDPGEFQLKGKTNSRQFLYQFDTVLPYHACAQTGGTSCGQALTAPDLTENPLVTISWAGGWTDDNSGLGEYQYEVYSMRPSQGLLMENALLTGMPVTLNVADTSATFTLTTPAMYQVILHVLDNAGNLKSARKVLLFDNVSVVNKKAGKYSRVTTASSNTSYVWVVKDTSTVEVTWTDLFINQRHEENQWLNAIKSHDGIEPSYDDRFGNRTTAAIDHVHGVFDFWVAYVVYTTGEVIKDSRVFTTIKPNLHAQMDTLNINWQDGDQLNITIRAIDVLQKYDEETLVVYRDASAPIVRDLWLTLNGRTNLSVHSMEEFTETTIEWESFDYHSGIDTLYWKLYDNFTQTVIQHGHEDMISQREDNLAACQATYGGDPGDCYCTPFQGCYHQHFTVTPDIKVDGGLVAGLDKGIHDYDYYIEVKVTNIAQLMTTLTMKLTIDISPPHDGVVHDGVPGSLEVDYQQSHTLYAHWDGFFDRESGVKMYVYIFASSCQDKTVMVLDSGNPNIIETTDTEATYTAGGEGVYVVTVVAFNHALDPSNPVCSDGVTIDSSLPAIKEISVEKAMVRGGLVTDTGNTAVWIMDTDRTLRQLTTASAACVAKATVISDLDLYPRTRFENQTDVFVDGDVFCDNSTGAPSPVFIMLSKSSRLLIEWTAVSTIGGVFDYEFGLTSTAGGSAAPDILAYVSTKQNPHIILHHANVPTGTEFFIAVKTISKAEIENIQTLGPILMDTTAPTFSGSLTVTLVSDHLVTTWTLSAFLDSQEYYDLFYTFAIGHNEYGVDVQHYLPLTGGATCTLTTPPGCTAVPVADLDWYLHGHHAYYVTVRAVNSVGLFVMATSGAYIHDVQLAAKGVVWDVPIGSDQNAVPFTDMEESDFQTDQTTLQVRWSRFEHPHLEVTYKVSVGTTSGASDVQASTFVASNHTYEKTGLSLVLWQTYYFTVEAVTSVGSVSVTSDGVTIVQTGATLTGVVVYDGKPCNMTVDNGTLFKHHEQDNRVRCAEERDFQTSLNTMQAYWTVDPSIRHYTPDIHWAVEQEAAPRTDVWTIKRDYEHRSTVYEAETHDLVLVPGRTYRVALKLCARDTCFAPVHSDGVLVLANTPTTGDIVVTHVNKTLGAGTEKLTVQMDQFYDPDMTDPIFKYDAIHKYEWSVTDNSVSGKVFIQWTDLVSFNVQSGNKMTFDLLLAGEMDFSRCKRLSVRGYNKAKLYSIVSSQVKDCTAFNPKLIVPNVVVDAIGEQDYDETGSLKDGYGKGVFLQQNALWEATDVDYTPYLNMISAVWDALRHRNYTYAVLQVPPLDVTTYYRPTNVLNLPDPCSHSNSIKCGHTESEYANINFGPGILQHGSRYMVCVHARRVDIQQETWVQSLEEVNTCSDGVVVDLSSPTPGNVWIGHVPGMLYQTTLTDMFVNWESFADVEEFDTASHSTGIQAYVVGIGTTAGGNDVVDFRNVGVVNHVAFHGLTLQNGHTYFATITAMDHAGRNTTRTGPEVVVDVTHPEKSDKPILIDDRHITARTEIGACWVEVFSDLESGVQRYLWAIGSEPGYDDVLQYTDVGDVTCAVSDSNSPLDFHEGHAYYITVRAYNGAGLYSQAVSWAITVDLTPPTPGHVYDGKPGLHPDNQKDLDVQTDRSYLAAFWEGFYEAHSSIREYSVSIGTCRNCQDVLEMQDIGITNEFVLTVKHLGVGLMYYTTVTACNTANMCSSITSDGIILDNSPPTKGMVLDGTMGSDIHYQASETFLGAMWYGFSDPQSGLDHYEWWVGTTRGGEEVMSKQILHLTEVVNNPAVSSLPVGQAIYIAVRAYNKAGRYVDAVSNGFTVDNTAPIITKPELARDLGSINEGSIVVRTSLHIKWTADDPNSYIERQYLSMKAHRGGEFHLSSTKVNGIVRDYIFTGLDLHDGVNYYVNLIACNGAGTCSQAVSDAIFVDSSPPTRGMFFIQTNHASDIQRHVPNSMTWTSGTLYLSWNGFTDLHSYIECYFVNVGSTYMAGDLNKKFGTPIKVMHSNISEVYEEGHIQNAEIQTQDLNQASSAIFIHMWAVNRVGLHSPMIHSLFNRISGGSLELVRRCEAYSCLGHCICAPQDQVCPYSHMPSCTNYTAQGNPNSPLEVNDVTDLYQSLPADVSYTPTDVVLSTWWRISNIDGLQPLWYEWSVGFHVSAEPEGVFHQIDDRVWHAAGQNTEQIFSLSRGKTPLLEEITYAFFIRVWYASNIYAIYKSNGITIATRRPTPTVLRGSAVTESNWKYSYKDMDYLEYQPFMVSWKNKFLNAETYIESFRVYLSTYPGGDDVYPVVASFPGTTLNYNFTRYKLDSSVKYFSNVVAKSYSGLHHTESSDGFIIDNNKPVMGTVYDGTGIHDIEYQRSTTRIGARWHGFVDVESGVRSYHWCVGTSQIPTECSVLSWQNVGLRTAVRWTNLTTPLTHGARVYNKIYAMDGVGQRSDTAVSDGVTVDTSAPIPLTLVHHDQTNLAANPSFEETGGSTIPWSAFNGTDICGVNSTHSPNMWYKHWESCVAVISSDTNLAKDGRSMVLVRGTLSQDVAGLVKDDHYRVTFATSHLPVVHSVIANKEGFIEFGDHHVFLMYTKAYRHDDHGATTREIISWHGHTFYFVAKSTTVTLRLGSMDRGTGILIDDVQIHRVSRVDNSTSDTVVTHVRFLHQWGSIHAAWGFLEEESHITEYLWAIGYKKGGTQVQDFRSVGQQRFASNNTVSLVHKSKVYVTIVATNTAGHQGIAYSQDILVDLTPPNILAVYDGSGTGATDLDLDSWEQDEILVNWQVTDEESGVDFCEWAIGYQPYGNELQTFTRMGSGVYTGQIQDVTYEVLEGRIVYSTIRCQNMAGLQSVRSSDGVRISKLAPAVDNVQFWPIKLTQTEYNVAPHFQSVTDNIRLVWTGFTDNIGLEGYQIAVDGVQRKMLAYHGDQTYMWIHSLYLADGEHDLTLSAVNLQYKVSPKVITNLTVFTQPPSKHPTQVLDVTWNAATKELTVSWTDLFTSEHELTYEVSAGSNVGAGDILQWQETKATSLTMVIPPVITDLSSLRIYVIVRAVTLGGMSAVKMGSIVLPAVEPIP